jgi:hypothetical protein
MTDLAEARCEALGVVVVRLQLAAVRPCLPCSDRYGADDVPGIGASDVATGATKDAVVRATIPGAKTVPAIIPDDEVRSVLAVDDIGAVAAIEPVFPCPADQEVVALAAVDAVASGTTHDEVISSTAEDPVPTAKPTDDVWAGRANEAVGTAGTADVAVPRERHLRKRRHSEGVETDRE